jgi:tRNA pseudouridine38-40 synthase
MSKLRLTLAYDGSDFVGWQRQATGVSIQGLVEAALARVTGVETAVTSAGRTDAGVHALGQVASARVAGDRAPAELQRALNALLPAAVRVVALDEVSEDFHARYSARAKRYAYRIAASEVLSPFERRYAWHVTHALDRPAMARALGLLVGTHDFAAFQAAGSRVRDTVRTLLEARLDAESSPSPLMSPSLYPSPWPRGFSPGVTLDPGGPSSPGSLTIALRGDGFLRHMVRNIVGTLVEIGRGRWPVEQMAAILASRDRSQAGPTAPAQGLFLVEVEYD